MEKKRLKRAGRLSTDGYPGPNQQQQQFLGGAGGGGGGGNVGTVQQNQAALNELRRQETLELAKRRKQQMMAEDFGGSGGGSHFAQDGPSHFPPHPLPPRRFHDAGPPGWAHFGPPMPMYPHAAVSNLYIIIVF